MKPFKKTKKWYEGNPGLLKGRSLREASLAGHLNPKNKPVQCEGCGRDTNNYDMLCDECSL